MNPLHNQDMQIVDSANQASKAFRDLKEVSVDHASIGNSSTKRSSWWSAVGLRNASWKKAKGDTTKDETVSKDKELPTNHELSDEELSDMLNR